jgi:MFS family permease
MNGVPYKVSGYRWAVLGATMAVNFTIQALWISYAPVTGMAAAFYKVGEGAVGLFSMAFMIAFIPLSIPASWLIDRIGFAKAVGLGALATGAFGLLRGLSGSSYGLALAATWGMAASQPLLLNAWTKMPAAWFPEKERATAVGLTTIANLAGTALGLALTPILAERLSIPAIQFRYGIAAAVSAALFVALAREKPRLPPDESASRERALVLDGLKGALRMPAFRRYLVLAFVGMGVFNGIATWIEAIVRPRGVEPAAAGALGALMLAGGLAGAALLPPISDRSGRRKPFIVGGLALASLALLALALAPGFATIAASAIALGFFLVAVSPIGMQYAAETARPAPEGATNGLVSLAGQASVALVWAMEAVTRASGSFAVSLALCAGLLALSALLAATLKEPGKS